MSDQSLNLEIIVNLRPTPEHPIERALWSATLIVLLLAALLMLGAWN